MCGLFLPKVLNLIPLASLAAILLMVGYKLAKPQIFVVMYSNGWSNFVPFSITILGIIFLDLLSGIGLGMVCALIHILWSHYKIPYNFTLKDDKADKKVVIQLAEHVSFLNKPVIIKTLEHLPNNSNVIIDASKSKTVHPDIVEIICDFRESAKSKNITGYIDDIGYFGNTSRYKVRLDNDQIIDVTAQNQKRPKDEKDRLTYEDKVNLSWDNSSAMLLLK